MAVASPFVFQFWAGDDEVLLDEVGVASAGGLVLYHHTHPSVTLVFVGTLGRTSSDADLDGVVMPLEGRDATAKVGNDVGRMA